MGSDKSFNDARVLRTDDTTLVLRQLKMLLNNLEQGEHNLQDLRKLDGLSKKIEEVLGEYSIELEKRTETMMAVARASGTDSPEFRAASQDINTYVADAGGVEASDVIITPSEWDWLKTRWNSNTKLVGSRSVRADILAIDDVVQNAKGVKIKDKKIFIQGEQEPGEMQHLPS